MNDLFDQPAEMSFEKDGNKVRVKGPVEQVLSYADHFFKPDPPPFHNTTGAEGTLLADYMDKAGDQDAIVLAAMKVRKKLSPSMLIPYFKTNTPITSIRRAVSNLAKRGLLEKLDEKVKGGYGRMEHYWKYIEPQG